MEAESKVSSSRLARRKKIVDRDSDRLALITGQIKNLPPPSDDVTSSVSSSPSISPAPLNLQSQPSPDQTTGAGCPFKLGKENNEFFELISDKYLLETRYSISIWAAALRLFLSCSFTWTYPHVFDENVLEKIKGWVIEENIGIPNEVRNDKCDIGEKTSSDIKMLKTYSTGLLAVALIGGGPVVEDVLSSGLVSNLMRYLRNRVLGDTNTGQKYAAHQADKNVDTAVIDAANATDVSGL